jgi:hypothetical protein
MGQVLDATPATWLIALQLYRVFGSVFLVGWARNVIPGLFALPAGIGDVITGLLAVPIAISLAADAPGARRAAIGWNVFGLVDFAVAVSIGLMISPVPLQLIISSIANATVGVYPNVMVPAFAVPSSILLDAVVASAEATYDRPVRSALALSHYAAENSADRQEAACLQAARRGRGWSSPYCSCSCSSTLPTRQ